MRERHKYFSEYRHKDYRTPRSTREAFGRDVDLYVEDKTVGETNYAYLFLALCTAVPLLYLVYRGLK